MGIASRKRRKTKKIQGNVRQPKKANRPKTKSNQIPKISKYVREMWSKHRTTRENFDRIGLAFDANEVVSKKNKLQDEEADIEEVNLEDIDDYIAKQQAQPKEEGIEQLKKNLNVKEERGPKEPNLGMRERWYWLRLYRKYEENYKAMAIDMKLNYRQYTKAQCKNKIAILLKYHKDFMEEPDDEE